MLKIINVEPSDDYKLKIVLSDGRRGIFDVSPYLDKGVFSDLRDPHYFRLVKPAFGGKMWPREQDFSAETIEYELKPQQN